MILSPVITFLIKSLNTSFSLLFISHFRNSLNNINLYLQHQKWNKVILNEFLVFITVLHLKSPSRKSSHVLKAESQLLHRMTCTKAGLLSVKGKAAIHGQSKAQEFLKTIVRFSFTNYMTDLWKCNKSVLTKHPLSNWDFYLNQICMSWQLLFLVNHLIWVDN